MVDTNVLVRQYLLQNSTLLALLGPYQVMGHLPEKFNPLSGPIVVVNTEGGNAHPEIPIQTQRVKIRVWAGVDGYQIARQVYGVVHDWLHGQNDLDFGDFGTILASIETVTGQDITDPDSGWATVLAYYDVTVRDGAFTDLSGTFQQGSQTKAYIDTHDAITLASAEAYTDAHAGGGTGYLVQSVNSTTVLSYSASFKFIAILATGGNTAPGITLTLPTAVGHAGSAFLIKRIDSGSYNAPVVLAFTSGQSADSRSSISLWHQWDEISLISDGTNWVIESVKGGPASEHEGGVQEVDTTVAHDSTYPVGTGMVLKAALNNGVPYVDAGPYGSLFSVKTSGSGSFYAGVGSQLHGEHAGTGTVQRLIGAMCEVWNSSSGTIAEFAAAVTAGFANRGGGPIVTGFGVFVDYNDTTNITNFAAVFIAPTAQSFLGIANAWSVYVKAGDSFFGGRLYIGSDPDGLAVPHLTSFSNPSINAGAGTPEGVVSARIGSIYFRSDGGSGTSLYVKESGTGNTGWKNLSQLLATAEGYTDSSIATEASSRSAADALRQLLSEKDAVNGYAGLTSGGLLKAAEFPAPTSSLFGGIKALAAVAHKFLTSIGTDGIPVAAQPDVSDVSGLAAIASSGKWSDLQNPTSALTLSGAGNATTFNQTSAVTWKWANTTAATSGTPQSSPLLSVSGQYWTGAASAEDSWTLQDVIASGTNGESKLTFTHSGSSGQATLVSSFIFAQTTAGASNIACSNNAVPINGTCKFFFSVASQGQYIASDAFIAWGNNSNAANKIADLYLSRSAAGTLAVGTTSTTGNAAGSVKAASYSTGTATWTSGTGSPEGAVTAPVGSLFTRTDGGAATTLYVKESGAGNTGWIAK